MTTAADHAHHDEGIADGVVQFRFTDDTDTLQTLSAANYAEAVQGLVEFASQMSAAGLFGEGPPPQVHVRGTREGSVVLEAVIGWIAANPEGTVGGVIAVAVARSAGQALGEAFKVALRRLHGRELLGSDPLPNGNVRLTWAGGGVNEVPVAVWGDLNKMKRQTRGSMRKLMAPLSDDSVSKVELRAATVEQTKDEVAAQEPNVVATREDYRAAAAEPPEEDREPQVFDVEAEVRSVDFRRGQAWRVRSRLGTRSAVMEDEDFRKRLDGGLTIASTDVFDLRIREDVSVRKGRTYTKWAIVEVVRHRRGDTSGQHAS